jgi:hypothetical protein
LVRVCEVCLRDAALDESPEHCFAGVRLACGTGDGEPAHVDVEVVLGEEPGTSVSRNPRLAEHLASVGQHTIDCRRIDIATIDVKLGDSKVLALDIVLEFRGGFFFGTVGRGQRAGQDEMQTP